MTKPHRTRQTPALRHKRKGAYRITDTVTRIDGNEPDGEPGFSWIGIVAVVISVILSLYQLCK